MVAVLEEALERWAESGGAELDIRRWWYQSIDVRDRGSEQVGACWKVAIDRWNRHFRMLREFWKREVGRASPPLLEERLDDAAAGGIGLIASQWTGISAVRLRPSAR